jgi:hypothetical protein
MPIGNSNDDPRDRFQDFLTPEAMLTPGVAGSMTMMITNALALNFAMSTAWTALVLSFVFGLLVLAAAKEWLVKAVLYVLNSLVIFCVAMGANGIGVARSGQASLSLIPPAHAQAAPVQVQQAERCANIAQKIADAQRRGASNEEVLRLLQPCQTLSKDILSKEIGADVQAKKFFQPWKF